MAGPLYGREKRPYQGDFPKGMYSRRLLAGMTAFVCLGWLSTSVAEAVKAPTALHVAVVVIDVVCFVVAMWILFVALPRLERHHHDGDTATPPMQRLAWQAQAVGMGLPAAFRLVGDLVAFLRK